MVTNVRQNVQKQRVFLGEIVFYHKGGVGEGGIENGKKLEKPAFFMVKSGRYGVVIDRYATDSSASRTESSEFEDEEDQKRPDPKAMGVDAVGREQNQGRPDRTNSESGMRLTAKSRDIRGAWRLLSQWGSITRCWGVAMRLKWIVLCCLLGFIVVLDPTHTPAQPQFGGKGSRGEFGGKGGKRNKEFKFNRGDYGSNGYGRGNYTPSAPAPAQPAPAVVYGVDNASSTSARPTTYMSTTGNTGSFPAPSGQFGGGRGPFGGGRGSMGDPNAMWDRMSPGKDSINLNDPQFGFMKRMMERQGQPIPANGVVTKQMFVSEMQKRMGGSSGGPPGGAMVVTMGSGSMGDGRMSFSISPESRMNFNGSGGSDRGGNDRDRGDMANWSGGDRNRSDTRRNGEDERPVAIRYGHLPKGLPEWFDEYDGNKDGQVALHEWRKAGESIESFGTYDLNGDGLITADEVIRQDRNRMEEEHITAIKNGTPYTPRSSFAGTGQRGPGNSGGQRGPGGRRGSDDPAPTGISLPGSSPDSTPVTTERGPSKKERKGDAERNADRSEKPDRGEKDEPTPGNNGRWGTGGKKKG